MTWFDFPNNLLIPQLILIWLYSKTPGHKEQLKMLLTSDCRRDEKRTVVKRDILRAVMELLEIKGEVEKEEVFSEDEEKVHICSG